MVKTFQAYLPTKCHRTYSCVHCRAHLANHDELISKPPWSSTVCCKPLEDHNCPNRVALMTLFVRFYAAGVTLVSKIICQFFEIQRLRQYRHGAPSFPN
ncbi:hypothetical protein RRG08_016196 [Elysia crispata]|uniref:Yippee domain-containing protein n=1 Tax=Elysia crispata TaxID=231223 RepID=A0AAE0ZPP2_9GAST|nr:hypothetical protein RRG08_016196 [Elysia crispata]